MPISLLGIVNALMPRDRGSRKLASGIPYGGEPRQGLDIYAPVGAIGPVPVVLFIYGGSWNDGTRRDYDFAGRALAALGYVTVVADYRVVPQVEYPAFLEDGVAVVDWMVEHIGGYGGDAGRIALMGHSAGAYNAMMLALDPAYLAKNGLLQRVKAVVGLSGPYDFLPFDVAVTLRTFGAVRQPELTQPVNLVTAAAPPMFLGTGDSDTLVYPRNTQKLAEKLREAGVPVVERHFPKAGHAMTLLPLGRPLRGRVPVLAELAVFLRQYLG